MKRFAIFFSSMLICLMAAPTAFGQKGCELSVVGTWKAANPNESNSVLYRFGADGAVTMLSSGAGQGSTERQIGTATYTLDDPKAPKTILIKTSKEVGGFAEGITSMDITAYDDISVTFKKPGSEPIRWVKDDPYRYFMVLAGRIRTFYDGSGPTFPMMIKTDGRQTQIDAVGTYPAGSYWAFGSIPPEIYNQFMNEPRTDSDVLLRLELSGVQYERAVKVVRTWDRRVREGDLLYPDVIMDNILLAKQVTESLNQCGEKFKLYKLDWSLEDRISSSSPRDDNPFSRIPFLYFKELRRLNESRHVTDEMFHKLVHPVQKASAR